jgi:hypothetical protein
MRGSTPAGPPVTVRTVVDTWWPLAASWLLMGLELPLVSAVVARLPEPTISLAAYGAVVFPLSLLIESPIIMLLSASTALSRDWASYRLVRRFMWTTSGGLTAVHMLVAFTPLYDLLIRRVMGVPDEVAEPARAGLQIMTPWTVSIAYRRFQQGVLIRFGHSRAVGVGTAVRLASNAAVLGIGYAIGSLPGIVVGSAAVATGVVAEAIYAGFAVRPVLRDRVRQAPPPAEPLTSERFMRFYTPLMITPIMMFLAMPLSSAAMSRMPLAVGSLAVWPVYIGLVFVARSVCFGLNEVVVALLDRPGAYPALARFTAALALSTSLAILVLAATPLGSLWFSEVAALRADLVPVAHVGLWLGFLLPGITAYQSLYQGAIVHSHDTRGVTESMALYIATLAGFLAAGVTLGRHEGFYVVVAGWLAGNAVQLAWLGWRASQLGRRAGA